MKQLLSISKQRKQSKSQTLKQIIQKQPQQQQHNFIYQDQQSDILHENDDGPTQNQIQTYASILGIKLPQQQHLLYIAKQCLNQPMPPQWHCEQDQRGEIFYVNNQTGQISMEHPCDQRFRQKVIRQRKKKLQGMKKNIPKINMSKSKTNFIENVFKAKINNQQLLYQEQEQEYIQVQSQNKKVENFKKSKNIANLISENIYVRGQPREEDDDDFQPVNPMKMHIKRQKPTQLQKINININSHRHNNNNVQIHDIIPPKHTRHPKQPNPNTSQMLYNKNSSKTIKSNLFSIKSKQIYQKMHKKYQLKNEQLQKRYMDKIKQMYNKQNQLRITNSQNISQFINHTIINQHRKQLQTKIMLKHTLQLDKKRNQAQRIHRNNLLILSSQYQIQQLFTQMSQCRKFITRQKPQKQKINYLNQLQQNLQLANKLQINKIVSDIQKQCNTIMYQIVDNFMKNGNFRNMGWQELQQIKQQFRNKVDHIIDIYLYKQNNGQSIQLHQKIHKQQQIKQEITKKQSNTLYTELQSLRKKLKQLQQDNNTQRSNLSDKQSKLFQLLQNRVMSSARSSSDSK